MYKQILQKILDKKGSRNYTKGLKENPDLLRNLILEYGNLSLAELFYNGLYSPLDAICENNNRKKFKNIKEGYRSFCGVGKNCKCRMVSQKEKMSKYQQSMTPDERTIQLEKQKKTLIEKYGVDNYMKTEEGKEKLRNLDHTVRLKNAQNAYKKKTGFNTPFENPKIIEKTQKTYIKRHGKLMGIARKALYKKYNGNPFSNTSIQNKIKNILLNKYGVEFPNQNIDIQEKLKKTFLERYGVENASQLHLSPEAFNVLNNKDILETVYQNYSINEIRDIYNVSKSYIIGKLKHFNIINNCQSIYEQEISDFLTKHNIKFRKNDRKIIAPKEIDFVLEDYNIGIEFCGLYWHSEYGGKKNKDYHYNKWLGAKEKGITLYTIFEDEWENGIWFNRLLSLTNKTTRKLHGRECIIKYITSAEANTFLVKNHLQGKSNSKWFLGGFYKDELIGVMSFSKNRSNLIELTRFCSKQDTSIRGLASKFLNFFASNQNINSIISFSDNRYSDGNLYKTLGFIKEQTIKPDYQYLIGSYTKRYHKFNFSKKKISEKFNIDVSLGTEKGFMKTLGYDRIWDCGKIKWVWTNS